MKYCNDYILLVGIVEKITICVRTDRGSGVKQIADRRGQRKGGGGKNWQKCADILYK